MAEAFRRRTWRLDNASRCSTPRERSRRPECRNQAVGIQLAVRLFIIAAEFSTPIDPVEIDTEFRTAPQDFLHVGGVRSSPNFEHRPLPHRQFSRLVSPSLRGA